MSSLCNCLDNVVALMKHPTTQATITSSCGGGGCSCCEGGDSNPVKVRGTDDRGVAPSSSAQEEAGDDDNDDNEAVVVVPTQVNKGSPVHAIRS
jgi:hypothetical protein